MQTRENPCKKDCPERQIGCHAHCERHHLWKEQEAQRKENIQKQREIDDYILFTHRKLHFLTARRYEK